MLITFELSSLNKLFIENFKVLALELLLFYDMKCIEFAAELEFSFTESLK